MSFTVLEPSSVNSTATFTFANLIVSGNLLINANTDSTLGNSVTANYFIGDGSLLTGISSGSTYANSNVADYLPTYTGNISANYFIGNGSTLTYITGANVTGYVPNATDANTAATVTTSAQPNITSTGTLTGLTVSGLLVATGTGIKVANIEDSTGTVTLNTKYNNQAGDIGVYGNITAGTGGSGNVTATYFIGNGSQLTGLPASYSNTNVAAYLPTYTGNISANYFIGNGSTLTYITGSNVTGYVPNANIANTATTAGTVTTAAQPNITSVGTLSSATITTATITTGNITTGNFGNSVFTKFQEKVVSGGSVTGTITPDASAGTIYNYTLTGSITLNSLTNAVAGTSMTLILTQGGAGSYTLSSTMKFAGGTKTLSTAVGAIDIVSVFYDGSTYYAALSKGYA